MLSAPASAVKLREQVVPDTRVELAAYAHAAIDVDDLVLLDINQDVYACLPGAAAGAALEDGGRVLVGLDTPQIAALEHAGLLGRNAQQPDVWRLPRARRDLASERRPVPTLLEGLDFIAMGLVSLGSFKRWSFARLITGPRGGVSPQVSAALIRRAQVFAAMAPWSPVQGACLLQAYALRRYLRRRKLDAHWVFGVRTWPFAAHCWLQVDDLVLNDTVDRVAAYRPILVS